MDFPADPDPPFVSISAPGAIGHCDDLTVEGSVTVAFLGEVTLVSAPPTILRVPIFHDVLSITGVVFC